MRIKGTDRKALQKLADAIVVQDGYADLYPSTRRRVVELLSAMANDLQRDGIAVTFEKQTTPQETLGHLMGLHELTAAEARLALHLMRGGTLPQYAAAQSISRHTARTHLRAIFQKTGVNRQADLVRLLVGTG